MAERTPEQLEKEADDLFNEVNGITPDGDSDPKPDESEEAKPTVDPEGDDSGKKAEATTKTESPDKTSDTDDLTVGITLENASERIRNAQARMHTATQEVSGLRKSNDELASEVAPLKASIDRLNTEVQEWKAKAETTEANVDAGKMLGSDEDMQYVIDEYPDMAKPFMGAMTKLKAELDELKTGIANTAAQQAQTSEEAATETHFSAIREAHPDGMNVVKTDDFRGWLARQTPVIQSIMEKGTSLDVIWMLDEYGKAVGNVSQNEAENDNSDMLITPSPSRSRTKPNNNATQFTKTQIGSMSAAEYAKNEKAIDEAMSKGLIA